MTYGGAALPLPSLLCLGFAFGIAVSLAARVELRLNPRSSLLTRAFTAYALFVVFTLIPISIYFYVFHGDWFLLYLVDVRAIPSALALLLFVFEAAIAFAGFWMGANFVRAQRGLWAGIILGLTIALAILIPFFARSRLAEVGTFSQYHGGFGLSPYPTPALLHGTILAGIILVSMTVFLIVRMVFGGRRRHDSVLTSR